MVVLFCITSLLCMFPRTKGEQINRHKARANVDRQDSAWLRTNRKYLAVQVGFKSGVSEEREKCDQSGGEEEDSDTTDNIPVSSLDTSWRWPLTSELPPHHLSLASRTVNIPGRHGSPSSLPSSSAVQFPSDH